MSSGYGDATDDVGKMNEIDLIFKENDKLKKSQSSNDDFEGCCFASIFFRVPYIRREVVINIITVIAMIAIIIFCFTSCVSSLKNITNN